MAENTITSGENLYATLQEACRQMPDYRKAYQTLNRVFQFSLNDKANVAGARFNGPFAKTDYLLKKHHSPHQLQRSVHEARVRFRRLWQLGDSDMEANFAYDLKAVCQFVELVYGVPAPATLKTMYPKERRQQRGELKTECLRIIVNRWDDTYIYADADAVACDEVKVFYGGRSKAAVYKDWDWSYLRGLLKAGCQLNLIRPREDDGILYPELLIWEPDYLVDISAIAACFESYGLSPLTHLLNRLKPSSTTQPMVLGNLASQFLDEELCQPEDSSYENSVRTFFQEHALSLLTAGIEKDFHEQAKNQKRNIRTVLRKTLPELLQSDNIRFDATEMMVEPSFFSEMLGLQGRMDFLQLGQQVLIEQKSGKAQYPESDPPRQQEKHYVQLLLYMLLIRYNYRGSYDRNGHRLYAFLLYSKYPNGLLPLGFAPELVFAAIKVRNEIAANDYAFSTEGFDVLRSLSADSLNGRHVNGPLWERFQKPQINSILLPIQTASPLEQAYFLRFMRFLETEHLMAKVGSQTKENAGFADKWLSSLADKMMAGNIYCDLEMLSPEAADCGRVDNIVLGFTAKENHDISNFRKGDIVILYPYAAGEEPDARKTMVFRATIESITADKITLSLRATQTDAHVFWYGGRCRWAIEHDFFESSFASLYRGLHAFLTAPQERRDLLLLQRKPRVDKTKTLCNDYGDFNDLVLKAKQAEDLFLMIGPPGTGKTSFGLMNTLREELASNTGSVLLLSYTNRAVDEICEKLIACGIDFIRIGGRHTCEEACRPYLLDAKIAQCCKMSQLRDVLDRTRVFVGTTTAFNANINIFQLKQFSLAIIDEASQILEPHLAGLLSATAVGGGCAIQKMILIGDHKQLSAVVQQRVEESVVTEPALNAIRLTNCRHSLFERLLRQYRDNPDVTYMLTRQGRMHHDIARFPNAAFYQGRLREVPLKHQEVLLPDHGLGVNGIDDLLQTRRIAFLAVPETPQAVSDKVNNNEARFIAATVARIYALNKSHFSPLQTVGVIVPYRNQIAEIRNCIAEYGIEALQDITIDTVERYQGSQRDYILYGFTVQKSYQLSFLTDHVFEEDGCTIDRKLNVAMTRAREHLLLFGNPHLLADNQTFSKLMAFVKDMHGFFSISLDDYIEGRFTIV